MQPQCPKGRLRSRIWMNFRKKCDVCLWSAFGTYFQLRWWTILGRCSQQKGQCLPQLLNWWQVKGTLHNHSISSFWRLYRSLWPAFGICCYQREGVKSRLLIAHLHGVLLREDLCHGVVTLQINPSSILLAGCCTYGHQQAITQMRDYFKCNSSYHLIALYKSDHHLLWILLWEVNPSKLTHQVCCLKKWHFAAITQMKDYRPSNFLQNWPILTPHTKEDSECPRQNLGKKSQQEHYQLRSFRSRKGSGFPSACRAQIRSS